MRDFLQKAKQLKSYLGTIAPKKKIEVLNAMAESLRKNEQFILKANEIDLKNATTLSQSMQQRLKLNGVEAMAVSLEEIAQLVEPVGRVLDGWVVPSGLSIQKVTIPIGVVAIIYESRPNVTSDCAGLCFKSSNVCVLKGGKEARESNRAIAKVLRDALERNGIDKECIHLLEDDSREAVGELVKMDRYIDLIIPRGGEGLIKFVSQNATIPVIKHDKGVCHLYIDKYAKLQDAYTIALNAKCQRTSACNSIETLLVHEDVANEALVELKKRFDESKTWLCGCEKTRAIIDVEVATDEEFESEYLDNKLSIKIVSDVSEAILHVNKFGSNHSDSIITQNHENAELFLNGVDSACVYLNASTRFTDGGEFGFGAEVGISTNKLHARGPMGINDLTTYKYKIYGNGQSRE